MPQLKKPEKTSVRSAESPSVLMPAGTYSRQFEAAKSLGNQISNMGPELAYYGYRLDRNEMIDDINKGELEFDISHEEYLTELEKDKDFASHGENYLTYQDVRTAAILAGIKHPGARKRLAEDFQLKKVKNHRDIVISASRKQAAVTRIRLPVVHANFVNNAAQEDEKGAKELREKYRQKLVDMNASGAIFSDQIDYYLAKFDAELEPVREARIFAAAVNTLKQIPDLQQSIEYIDKNLVGVLKREQRNDLLAITHRRFDGIDAQAVQKENLDIAKAEEEVWEFYKKGDLQGGDEKLEEYFNDRLVFSDDKTVEDWRDEMRATGDAAVKRMENDDDDDDDLFAARQIIDKVKNGDLTPARGYMELKKLKGLKPTTMDSRINELSASENPDDILNDPVNKIYLQNIADVIAGTGDDFDISKMGEVEETMNAFKSFLREKPRTEKEKQEKYNALMEPHIKSWFWESMGRFFTPLPVHVARLAAKKMELKAAKAVKSKETDLSKITEAELRAIVEGK